MLAALALAMSVGFDDRLELASAVQLKSDPSTDPAGFTRSTGPYAQALLAGLDCEGGNASERGVAPAPKSFAFADRAQVLLRLGPLPTLTETRPLEHALVERAGGREALEKWLGALRRCKFKTPAALLEPEAKAFPAQGYLSEIEAYAGLPLNGTYKVLLSPLQAPGGTANVVLDEKDGSARVLTVLGPDETGFHGRRAPGIIWHELGHGLFDPLAELWSDEIERRAGTYKTLPWSCYGEWRQCAREHVVRAVMLRLITKRSGKAAADDQFAFEGGVERYPAMPEILRRLEKEYEPGRKKYPTLADFYPRILDVFPAGAPARKLEPLEEPQQLLFGPRLRLYAEKSGRKELKARVDALLTPKPKTETPGEALRRRAMEAFGAGKKEESLKLFDEALKLDPADGATLLSRAVVLHALGRKAEAGRAYDEAVAKAEGHVLADALSSRATFLKEQGRQKEAEADLERSARERR